MSMSFTEYCSQAPNEYYSALLNFISEQEKLEVDYCR